MAETEEEFPPIKLVAVGDGAIGKTCLLISYTKNEFPKEYVPTVFENITKEATVEINGETKTVSLDLWDTAGQEEFDRIRPLSYRETDVFLLCFSVVGPASFENLNTKWVPEIRHHNKTGMILLVGLKSDLRNDPQEVSKLKQRGKEPVSTEQIELYKKQVEAIAYVECSALTKENVNLKYILKILTIFFKNSKLFFRAPFFFYKKKLCFVLLLLDDCINRAFLNPSSQQATAATKEAASGGCVCNLDIYTYTYTYIYLCILF
ncbi:hypothetical protein RFI_31233 [Reticulomyxa filosa]|uniref:Uncharacterized protein n=1 Tax=Reticulomyxa filosa TaxID=46433 RepID=X6LW34_RETFI|nr:hypothetical protein RFI_31233 [Reticulomyxa filosa]|eukprot:ETO06163.1 hypothetical protein RFI_31233 [Reticulomyxa filosa]